MKMKIAICSKKKKKKELSQLPQSQQVKVGLDKLVIKLRNARTSSGVLL
jgi:hypothetical protein